MPRIRLYKKIPCLFGRHKQTKKPLRLEPEKYELEDTCPEFNPKKQMVAFMGKELYYCERCFKILMIGHFPPHHPNCLCTGYFSRVPDRYKNYPKEQK